MSMLSRFPLFPNFEPLTLDIREDYEQYLKHFETYSDFNFVSLWTYMGHECQLSNLNGNLIFKMIDYSTHEPFLSMLGDNRPVHTLDTLFKYLEESNLRKELRLVPATSSMMALDDSHKYTFHLDRDNFDYIIDVRKLIDLKGNQMKTKRRQIQLFKTHSPEHVVRRMDIKSTDDRAHIVELIQRWSDNNKKESEHDHVQAVHKLLDHAHDFHTIDLGIFVDKRLVAFTVNEVIHNHMYMAHFGNADKSVPGIYSFMEHETARFMHENFACLYFNFQQDLGIPNLRRSKLSYRPHRFLEKGIISRKIVS